LSIAFDNAEIIVTSKIKKESSFCGMLRSRRQNERV
jgi:hypothetical protein